MARFEKRTLTLLMGAALFAPVGLAAELSYEVWHGHSRPPHIRKAGNTGTLVVTDAGISFDEHYPSGEKPENPHAWRWNYEDIQQLTIAPDKLKVLTYRDNKWKLGADREYEFTLQAGRTFEEAYATLKVALDQRLVAALPDRDIDVLWQLPVKHARRFGGDHGVLQLAEEGVVFKADGEKGQSRTWRWQDIESISSSGPFQLTITTFERARMHYGDRKDFNFDLKQRMGEVRYNELWLRVNQGNGLTILRSYRDGR